MYLIAAVLLFAWTESAPPKPVQSWMVLLADNTGAYWFDTSTGKFQHDAKLARKPRKKAQFDPNSQRAPPPDDPIRRYRDESVTLAKGVTVRMLKNRLRMETRDGNKWLTKVGEGHHPVLRPDGKCFAYFKWSENTWSGKQRKSNLVIRDLATGKERVIVKDAHLCEVSWSPDGKTLAAGFDGNLDLYDAGTGKRTHRWVLRNIHDELYAHGAEGLLWSPSGNHIATRFPFLGGRTADDQGEFEDVFGDNELYLLDVDTKKVKMLKLPKHTCEGPIRAELKAPVEKK